MTARCLEEDAPRGNFRGLMQGSSCDRSIRSRVIMLIILITIILLLIIIIHIIININIIISVNTIIIIMIGTRVAGPERAAAATSTAHPIVSIFGGLPEKCRRPAC